MTLSDANLSFAVSQQFFPHCLLFIEHLT